MVLLWACKRTHVDKLAEIQDSIRGLKISKAPGPVGILNRALKHLYQLMIHLLVALFKSILRTQHIPPVQKHARVFCIAKSRKDMPLPSSNRTTSFLDTIGKAFKKILLSRILSEVSGQFVFRPHASAATSSAQACGLAWHRGDYSSLSSLVCISMTCPFLSSTSSYFSKRSTWPS